jgi:hypothetical protein
MQLQRISSADRPAPRKQPAPAHPLLSAQEPRSPSVPGTAPRRAQPAYRVDRYDSPASISSNSSCSFLGSDPARVACAAAAGRLRDPCAHDVLTSDALVDGAAWDQCTFALATFRRFSEGMATTRLADGDASDGKMSGEALDEESNGGAGDSRLNI